MPPRQQSIGRFFGGSATVNAKKSSTKDITKILSSPKKQENKTAQQASPKKHTTPPPANSEPEPKRQKVEASPSASSKNDGMDIVKDDTDPSETEPEVDANTELKEASQLIQLAKKEQEKHKGEKIDAKIPYSQVADVFDKIESESGRLKITAIVSQFFLEILTQSTPEKLVKIVYLFINRLGPDYEPDLELGLGETLLIKAISECYGRPTTKIKKDYQEVGDLGLVAEKSRSGQPTMFKPAPLDIDVVFENLTKIAKSTGKDSQSKKIALINKMLTACKAKSSEAKFLIRSLEGKLRIGLAEKTVLIALAQAFVSYEAKDPKRISPEKLTQAEDVIREAFSQVPNYEEIIQLAYKYGVFNLLDHCHLTPGIPLKPMLAKPTKAISEILDRFQGEEFTCEYKYDGERAQVHLLADGTVRIYSRNSEDMSQRYPDLISIVKDLIKTQDGKTPSMILDCEAVAWDRVNNKILPFQVLSTRKRKGVDEKDITVHICLFAFDILFFNDEPLITKSLNERREIMHENLTPINGKFQFATAKNSSNLDELQLFLDQSVKDSCEGLMVKMLNGTDSFYEPSKRSRNWLKLKKDYLAGVGDSLDLVVIGAYIGRGKRTGNYGGFLLASYNPDTGEYETTCKIGTGFSDEDLASLHARLKPTEISVPKPYYVYDTTNSNAKPDVWFEPTTLFEVLTADLSLSPIYKAAHQEYGKGISLRFPRFLRIRDDKGIEDATSSTQVAEFYEKQASVN
ncbi:ATP-dependent DNA ligase [Scheffersomyces xylosifermentans]|uniref:ATP-dependent DNA ligase n=1 Tax=Scheffersomyces xylosifermentans TaxID=1304137 RepID=UPI00315C940E